MSAPRVAFMFHSVHPSGGNLWLQHLLLHGPFEKDRCIAVLPGKSPLEDEMREAGIECHALPLTERALSEAAGAERFDLIRSKAKYYSALGALLRESRPDVVYVNSGVQVMPGIAAARAKIPVVWHVKEGWGSGPLFRVKRGIVVRSADALLFDSEAGMKLYSPIPKSKRAVVVPNGVEESLAQLREQRVALRERLGWAGEQQIVLFVGSIVKRKGVHELLDVWESLAPQFPQSHLVLVGPQDPNEQHPRLANLASQLPPACTYLGFRKDAHDLLAAADVFVLPSYGEAMPISISEAMMIGCPVVARDVADVPFQIGNGRGFLFSGDGSEPLKAALREAMQSSAECAKRAALAKEFALKHLTWTAHCALIRDVVFETAARGKVRP